MPAIGIDIGTTHCRVGVFQGNKVKIIVDDQDNRQIPCYVAFTDTVRLIGNPAKNQETINPSNTIFNVKRLIGRKLNDKDIQSGLKHWPFDLIQDSGKLKIQVEFRGEKKQLRPYEVMSMTLNKVKETAEAFLGEGVQDAVISVPAGFNYLQRQETKEAAEAAGLNVLSIINEPTAAVLAYGRRNNFSNKKYVVMFDLGASKCDVSIISIFNISSYETSFKVKSTEGNSQLGGEDFDSKLVEYFCQEFKRIYHKDIETDPRALKKLRIAAEKAKRTLSSSTEASIEINALFDGIDYYTEISRATFEKICCDLFRSTLDYVKLALGDANLEKNSIHDIILVGGSTHIPRIQSLLRGFFNTKELNLSINSYEAVAYGAAVQAALLKNEYRGRGIYENIEMRDFVTSSLGIEVHGGIMAPIIQYKSYFPCKKTRRFKTSFHNQQGISIRILEGQRFMFGNEKLIGQFQLDGITLIPSLPPMIDVTFNLDVNGTLRVTAANAESKINEDVPTLVNCHPYQNIEIEREEM